VRLCGAVFLAGGDDQPFALRLAVPATKRLRRAADLLRDLLALHVRGDQRQRLRMLFGGEPATTRRHFLASLPTGTRPRGLWGTVALRSTTAHERLQPERPAIWRPPSRRPRMGGDLRI